MKVVTSDSQEYATAGTYTFTPPPKCYWVWIKAIAGGGGGSSSYRAGLATGGSHGGGAGESCERRILKVTPGVGITVTVGSGGAYGLLAVQGVNSGVTELEGVAGDFSGGQGGNPTIIGPLRLLGGWGGSNEASNVAGMGGGPGAGLRSFNGGASGSNAAARVDFATGQPGFASLARDDPRWWSGSGGATGSKKSPAIAGARGGVCGPFAGGAGGAIGGAGNGGGGGAASIFGPGGTGGAGNAHAPAVPAGSYGAGGGGSGGDSTGGPLANQWRGAQGGDGYVLLTWLTVEESA